MKSNAENVYLPDICNSDCCLYIYYDKCACEGKDDMKDIKDWTFAALPTQIVFMTLVMILCMCCCSGSSKYSSVKNNGSWAVEFDPLNTTLEEDFSLNSGDTLTVNSDIVSGSIGITIGREKSTPVYEGNCTELGYFEVTVHEDGVYKISVNGKSAVGKISFDTKAKGDS